jgi:hypothetical protein
MNSNIHCRFTRACHWTYPDPDVSTRCPHAIYLDTLPPNLFQIIFTAKETQNFTITKINWLILMKEIL